MTAIIHILADYRARQQRLLNPLVAPRLAAALVAIGATHCLLPLAVACAATAAYREALLAVYDPRGPRG